ncbi:hypothetical protein HDU98_008606, partial [Podochytrium sp. JEL0797]
AASASEFLVRLGEAAVLSRGIHQQNLMSVLQQNLAGRAVRLQELVKGCELKRKVLRKGLNLDSGLDMDAGLDVDSMEAGFDVDDEFDVDGIIDV